MNGKILLKRKEIIEIWKEQNEDFLNMYCCPDCRDIMGQDENSYFCANKMCLNNRDYKKSEVTE